MPLQHRRGIEHTPVLVICNAPDVAEGVLVGEVFDCTREIHVERDQGVLWTVGVAAVAVYETGDEQLSSLDVRVVVCAGSIDGALTRWHITKANRAITVRVKRHVARVIGTDGRIGETSVCGRGSEVELDPELGPA